MLGRVIDDLAVTDLEELVRNRVSEGRRLEFKQDHYARTDEGRKEFAADVSAFANASGGDLIVGISEDAGAAHELIGVEAPDADQLQRAVSDALRTAFEPLIPGIRLKWFSLGGNRGVLLIRIPRSWYGPHRVVVARDSRFFSRDENGKHPMSVEELRRAFLRGDEIVQRMRTFRLDRLALLDADEGPLALMEGRPKLVLHFLPQAAFADEVAVDIDQSQQTAVAPLGASGWNSMHSIDGHVTYSGSEANFQAVRAFTTLFRTGVVEAVATIYTNEQDEVRQLDLGGIEDDLIDGVRHVHAAYGRLSIPAPVYFAVSLLRVRGFAAPLRRLGGFAFPQRQNRVLLPETSLGYDGEGWGLPALRPVCDLLWNAFGQARSPNFDQTGARRRDR